MFIFLVLCSVSLQAQLDGRKNTIRLNVTNPLIFGIKAYVVGYERVVSPTQSFAVNIGRMNLPAFGTGALSDSLNLQKNSGDKGFNISGEYRFYLKSENKFDTPHGIYIGPYYSYNSFSRSNTWQLNSTAYTGQVDTKLDLSIHTVGVQLGYQFVFWKRVAVDLVLMGPGVGVYNVKATLATSLNPDEKALFFQQLNEYIGAKIPGYKLVIDEGEFRRNGSISTTAIGFRYMVNVGYRF
jgi:hypothetical protein